MCEHNVARAATPFRLDELWPFTERLERYGIAGFGSLEETSSTSVRPRGAGTLAQALERVVSASLGVSAP